MVDQIYEISVRTMMQPLGVHTGRMRLQHDADLPFAFWLAKNAHYNYIMYTTSFHDMYVVRHLGGMGGGINPP